MNKNISSIDQYTNYNIKVSNFVYNPFSIANCIIDLYKQINNKDISLLELLKHQFFCYGWYYARYNKILFNGTFMAYSLGPIIRELYIGFDSAYQEGFVIVKKHELGNENISQEVRDFIEETIIKYIDGLPLELSDITHLPHTPWAKTVENKGLYAQIDKNLIMEYYNKLLKEKSLC